MDKELLEAISQMMDSKLSPINERLDKIQDDITVMQSDITEMKSDIDIVKEDSKITRNAVNNLLDWAEEAQVQVKIPLFRKAAE